MEQLADLSADKLRLLREKVTSRVQFNYYEVDEKLDVYVVFETMNNRGKELSTLEKLKNRLLYLSTLLPLATRPTLRLKINACWKLIYEWLAKPLGKVLDDDEFLRIHWIMYFDHKDRKKEYFSKFSEDLLGRRFNVKRVHGGMGCLTATEIIEYVEDLGASVQKWFELNFPRDEPSSLSKPVRDWINRINTLRPKSFFRPIILALLQQEVSENEKIQLLHQITA